jgi:hypothetical protein
MLRHEFVGIGFVVKAAAEGMTGCGAPAAASAQRGCREVLEQSEQELGCDLGLSTAARMRGHHGSFRRGGRAASVHPSFLFFVN